MSNKYYLGLDMGTASVGWAVTNPEYRILRAKGKDMWGVREFETASTAESRRTNRIARRRRQREVIRLGYLQSYFADAISEADPAFFERLRNSKYFLEDKDEAVRSKYAIFNDSDYTDTDYYRDFPTIFHLRKELIENPQEHDVRLVFLAIHNLFKHRGHFLNANVDDNVDVTALDDVVTCFYQQCTEIFGWSFKESVPVSMIKNILSRKDISRTRKVEELCELFEIDTLKKDAKTVAKDLFRCICGCSVNAVKLFGIEQAEEKKIDINFSSASYEENCAEIEAALGENFSDLIAKMKEIYDIGVMMSILGDFNYISFARVESYNKHHSDLCKLKHVIMLHCPERYDSMFRLEESGSYSAYVKATNSKGYKNRRGADGRKTEELYDTIKKCLKDFKGNPEVDEILNEIDNENFLPKQLTSLNSVIPNQIHLKELKKILKNAEAYLPFLKEVDGTGLSISQKIVALFAFHMPYYIGPTSEDSKNGWVKRLQLGPVLPWNYKDKIDIQKTSEEFIRRLIRECTYISGEKVLPKSSLIYEKYCVLNEINNLRIRGEKIDVLTKQAIYEELFTKGKKVTRKRILDFLRMKDQNIEDVDISGIDITINNYLSNYGKFLSVFGERMKSDAFTAMVEDIIYYATIYGDDRKRLKEILEDRYSDKLDAGEIKRVAGMRFNDWGRFSRSFLELQGCDKETGEVKSLLKAMWDHNLNMMELINSEEFTFKEALKEKRQNAEKSLYEFTFDDLDEYYFSAPVKRMIWQTLQIIKEIEHVQGQAPDTIFLEMARSEEEKGDKGRKNSREKALLDLYKGIKDEMCDWNALIRAEGASGRLKSKKMYLYIKQMGRDLYTGKRIDLDDLFKDNLYDIDHIYPRQFTTDNNIENNLALVYKPTNKNKSNDYPLASTIRNNPEVRRLWTRLHDGGLMNDEKYRRLTGNEPLSDEQKADFIARQLVETSQGTKGIADLLKVLLPDTKIVYSKAGNVSEFRHKYDLLKCRSLNDLHHAHDAYLNIVVGNVYDKKFTQNPLNFIRKEYAKDKEKFHYHLAKMFDWKVERDGEVAWIAETKATPGTIAVVKKMLQKTTPLMTRMSIEGHGGIANATLYSADKAKAEVYIPLKGTDTKLQNVSRYGGITSVSTAYFFLVEHEVKGKRIRTLETVPIYKKAFIEKNEQGLEIYCNETLGLSNPVVRVRKINLQSLVKLNGYYVYLSGTTNDRIKLYNAVNMKLELKFVDLIRIVERFIEEGKTIKEFSENDADELFEVLLNKHNSSIFNKRPNSLGNLLRDGKKAFLELSLREKCRIIVEIIKTTAIGSISGVDLKRIGGASKTGVMTTSKKINACEEFVLINQSVTGLYESRVDLLRV